MHTRLVRPLICGVVLTGVLGTGLGCSNNKGPNPDAKPTAAGMRADPSKMSAEDKKKYETFMANMGKKQPPQPGTNP